MRSTSAARAMASKWRTYIRQVRFDVNGITRSTDGVGGATNHVDNGDGVEEGLAGEDVPIERPLE